MAQIAAHEEKEFIVWKTTSYFYRDLKQKIVFWQSYLDEKNILPYSVVELSANFSPESIALFIVLMQLNCVIVPLSKLVKEELLFRDIAEVEWVINVDANDQVSFEHRTQEKKQDAYITLEHEQAAGLVLFSSGSTGKSKAAVHRISKLLEKFQKPRDAKRIISFLSFDHIGGFNTLFFTLYNGGCVITLSERSPTSVCDAIEKHHGQVLPTTPTFLNLLLLSREYQHRNLQALELITYGTEVMPENTLNLLHQQFPTVRLQQTYGLSEVGILRSKSKNSNSLFMKIGGEQYQTRIVDHMLEIKTETAMLGYLNAPNPFTEDGWFKTGDVVEVDGEYVRILGRQSDVINVGGEKVYPAEVENILMTMSGVIDVAILGITHPLIGQMVTAQIKLSTKESLSDFKIRLYAFCKDRLQRYKIPQKITLMEIDLFNNRFKKLRKNINTTNIGVSQ